MRYDLLVIGSTPAGQEAALAAAERHNRVALVEHTRRTVNGVPLPCGTVPVSRMREAIRHRSGVSQSRPVATGGNHEGPAVGFAAHSTLDPSPQITMDDLRRKQRQIARHERNIAREQFDRNGVDVYPGEARFLAPYDVEVTRPAGNAVLQAESVVIGCGTRPNRPGHIPFDSRTVFDVDDIWTLQTIPCSMIVVGAGVIGIEYALLFAELGVRVTVVDGGDWFIEYSGIGTEPAHSSPSDAMMAEAQSLGVQFRIGEDVIAVDRTSSRFPSHDRGSTGKVALHLVSGDRLLGEAVLFNMGRIGNTDGLNLSAAGLEPDECGRLWCNENLQTWVPHIYGVGDVVGYPPWAGDSTGQGRRVVEHAFGGERPLRGVHWLSGRSTAQHAVPRLQRF